MDTSPADWKTKADQLWSEGCFSHLEAARLVSEILQSGRGAELVHFAKQALPSLRNAAKREADPFRKSVARRRFGIVRDELHALGRPSFGRRGSRPHSSGDPSCQPDEAAYRRLLGLPLQGQIGDGEILAAYKRAAKTLHPDVGGSAGAFNEIVGARDVLLKR